MFSSWLGAPSHGSLQPEGFHSPRTDVIYAPDMPPRSSTGMVIAQKSACPVGWSWPPPSSRVVPKDSDISAEQTQQRWLGGSKDNGPKAPGAIGIWHGSIHNDKCEFKAATRFLLIYIFFFYYFFRFFRKTQTMCFCFFFFLKSYKNISESESMLSYCQGQKFWKRFVKVHLLYFLHTRMHRPWISWSLKLD